jgi:hypothetical protein
MDITEDFKEIGEEILAYLKESAGEGWEDVKEEGLRIVEETKSRLNDVANEALTGNLTPQFLAERAKDEITMLELNAIKVGVMSASFTQGVVNNVVTNFLATFAVALIKKLLGTIS